MSLALREQAVALYREGLARVTPERLVRRALQAQSDALLLTFLDRSERVPLAPGARVFVLAVGKAAAPCAAEAARVLAGALPPERLAGGLIVTKRGFALDFALGGAPFPQREAGHPVPDAAGLAAAAEVERLVAGLAPADVLLVLVSGGASALLPAPLPGVSLAEQQALATAMLRARMDIHEINRVRKALSRFKAGGLARLAGAARTVGLYLSDVPGDVLASIGSGPTVPEPVDPAGAIAVLRERGLWDAAPASIRGALERACAAQGGAHPSPPPPEHPPVNGLIGANRHLLHAIAEAAREVGCATRVVEEPTTGLNAEALPILLGRWEAWRREDLRRERPAGRLCLVSGGETLVEVTGGGTGGRCQELAALAMPRLDGHTAFLAAGSDGNDGPTDAAGGVVDAETWARVQRERIPYAALLADNDSYALLERCGALIRTPPTRNNLMDVHLFLGE
ncbi:MAG: DUF4147 domain-containing protein [Candidatus Lambdaproteobacteria bacterium]|nr:DUF4147 domain-containing protein [Candidatus Lambdaproteobacteria bacterium]